MELPTRTPSTMIRREPADIRAMALVVQANLVQLKVADAKRRGLPSGGHAIAIRPPGSITRFREALLDRKTIQRYTDRQLALLLHEVWGQFCMMGWVLAVPDPGHPVDLSSLPADVEPRCGAVLEVKLAEIHALLWRLRFELRRRNEPEWTHTPRFQEDLDLAEQIPLTMFGKKPAECSEEELVVAACEHVGMLSTLRWVVYSGLAWGAPECSELEDTPF